MEDLEDVEYVDSEHDQLVKAISKLDKTQHILEPTRSEPTVGNSEFSLTKRSNKLNLNNLTKVFEDTATHVKISKKFQKSHAPSKVLKKPLEKPQAERIKRATGYEETKKKVGRWDPVVARNRTDDYTVFPLKPAINKLQSTNEILARYETKSELEKQLEEIDPKPQIVEEDEDKLYPMSYEEMVEQRQHLAKIRAQQSYKEAKAKRQSKIKSKKYHRVLKKEKLKKQLKEFEELQKTDPEEALKKLETIEKARALERHTLRHKNTGKWAKNKLIRAKYDKEVRQQIAEQLAVSRGLTQKTQKVDSSDESDDNETGADIALAQDPLNPWMLKSSNKSDVAAEFDLGYKKYLLEKAMKHSDDSDSQSDKEKEADTDFPNVDQLGKLKKSIQNISKVVPKDFDHKDGEYEKVNSDFTENREENVKAAEPQTMKTKKKIPVKTKAKKLVATSNWEVQDIIDNNNQKAKPHIDISSAFDSLENKVVGKVEKKLKALRKQINSLDANSKIKNISKTQSNKRSAVSEIDNLEYLKIKSKKQKAIIDEELHETGKNIDESDRDATNKVNLLNEVPATVPATGSANIDPNRFIEVKPKYLNTALSGAEHGLDALDDDDEQIVPKVNIEDVFEEDDVVASFRQEKEDEINKGKPEDIDLSLPGWGSWGGKGVKAPRKRKNRFIVQKPVQQLRRDENKGDIIIKEYTDPKLSAHKVKDIPYPFTSVKDYEASIRLPLGNTFVPEKAHKKLIRPSVITKAGAIIEAMDEDELLVKKNLTFGNQKILKLVGQK